MTFRFLHTADLHLGKPFTRFPAELSAGLRAARIEAVGRLAAAARASGASHILVAGDVWDCETPSDATVRQPLDLMAGADDLTWWLLPGNHDPAARNGLWDRFSGKLPSNVRALTEGRSHLVEEGVELLPAPWHSRQPGRDLTADFVGRERRDGARIRIGLAHGSTQDFKGEGAASVIDPRNAERAGLSYLALGDWHGCKPVSDRVWYAGTPEADRFPKNEPGFALLVTIEGEAPPSVERVATGHYTWSEDRLSLVADDDGVARFEALHTGEASRRHRLCRLRVEGRMRAEKRAELLRHLKDQEGRYGFFEVDTAGLGVLVEEGDLDLLGGQGALRSAAAALIARIEDRDASREERLTAQHAFDLLLSMAA